MSYHLPLVVGIFIVIQAVFWTALVFWYRRRVQALIQGLVEQAVAEGQVIATEPQPAVYQGAIFGYPLRRGTGILCVTGKGVIFQKLFGPQMMVPITDIATATLGTGRGGRPGREDGSAQQLVIRTRGKNQVRFLLKDPGSMRDIILRQIAEIETPLPA